jgi:hypothetical protein
LAIITAVIKGWLEQNDRILDYGGYIFSPLIVICILVMAFYAVSYLWRLWKKGYRKEALQGLIIFIFLNILTGYLWFYWSEIKHQKIRFKLI